MKGRPKLGSRVSYSSKSDNRTVFWLPLSFPMYSTQRFVQPSECGTKFLDSVDMIQSRKTSTKNFKICGRQYHTVGQGWPKSIQKGPDNSLRAHLMAARVYTNFKKWVGVGLNITESRCLQTIR